jgi:hypothetical protein
MKIAGFIQLVTEVTVSLLSGGKGERESVTERQRYSMGHSPARDAPP